MVIQALTKLEAAVIKCTLSLSINYLVLQFIFIMQVVVYVFNPRISVFELISTSDTGLLYATLWYYMALPLTGFVNTIMLLKHNKNLKNTIRKLVVRVWWEGGGVAARCGACRVKRPSRDSIAKPRPPLR